MVEAKILIADDSKMNQQILSEILGGRYEYLYADDGMQALELLLLDINMPRLDGFGVLEVMKQRNWLQEIPVIITSSEDDESFIQKAYTTAGDEALAGHARLARRPAHAHMAAAIPTDSRATRSPFRRRSSRSRTSTTCSRVTAATKRPFRTKRPCR